MFQYTFEDAKLRDQIARGHDAMMAKVPTGILSFLDKWITLLILAFINNRRLKNVHAQVNAYRAMSGMSPQSYATTLVMDQLSTIRDEDEFMRTYHYEELLEEEILEQQRRDNELVIQAMRDERDEALRMYHEDPEGFYEILKNLEGGNSDET